MTLYLHYVDAHPTFLCANCAEEDCSGCHAWDCQCDMFHAFRENAE
jgi:hypothetical protein